MRIVSGVVGSMRLRGPARATRPTTDRVRESLFSILENITEFDGLHVLDLFAGTGALGLESASRGAQFAVMVENNPQAQAICNSNIEAVKGALRDRGRSAELLLFRGDANRFLDSTKLSFGLVFVDPPYTTSTEDLNKTLLGLSRCLHAGATVVLERDRKSNQTDAPPTWELTSRRTYGDTSIEIFRV